MGETAYSGDNFTVTYEAVNGNRVSISVEREPLGWVMYCGGEVEILGVRAPADLLVRACLELERRVMGPALRRPATRANQPAYRGNR